jgi:hypothetical protein
MSSSNKIELNFIPKFLAIALILILAVTVLIPSQAMHTHAYSNHQKSFRLFPYQQPQLIPSERSVGVTLPLLHVSTSSSGAANGTGTGPIIAFFMRPPRIYPDQMGLVNLYKQYITPNDYVITFTKSNLRYVDMLPGIKVFGFNSLAAIQARAQSLSGSGISVIAFDIEQGNYTVNTDLADPVGAICTAARIVHQYGFKLMANPGSGSNIPSIVGGMARCSDIILFQAQGHQRSPEAYRSFVAPNIKAIRIANPNIPIIIQVSFMNKSAYDPNPLAMVQRVQLAYASVANDVNGVGVFYSTNPPGQLTMMNQFFDWLDHQYSRH